MTGRLAHILILALTGTATSVAAGDSRCHPGARCRADLGLEARVDSSGPDGDGDGIADTQEAALAQRYAPIVTLDRDDWTRPASVDWLLKRVRVGARANGTPPARLRLSGFDARFRRGSSDPRDWKTYVHVYPSRDHRRVYVQYWFFYPYNDGPWFFDHEGDWEHVTVTLDAARKPLGVYAARHGDNAPGAWRGWSSLRKANGTHPEILSARGSHASYFDEQDVSWRDVAGRCARLDASCEHVLWRTWSSGGLQNMGELSAPGHAFLMGYRERWGGPGAIPGTFAPKGPAHQRGWCVDGACDGARQGGD